MSTTDSASTSKLSQPKQRRDRELRGFGKPVADGEDILAEASAQEAEDGLMQNAYNRDILTNILLSAGGQGAQFGAMAMKTDQDVRNKERLDLLQKLEKSGRLGLKGRERALAEATMLGTSRALSEQDKIEAEGRLATMGNQTSAADLNRIEKQASERSQKAALAAGMKISQAHLDKAAQQLQELDERVAYESEVKKGRREFLAKSVGDLGAIVGQARASRAVPKVNLDNIPAEQRAEVVDLLMEAASDPNPIARARKMKMAEAILGGAQPGTTQNPQQEG